MALIAVWLMQQIRWPSSLWKCCFAGRVCSTACAESPRVSWKSGLNVKHHSWWQDSVKRKLWNGHCYLCALSAKSTGMKDCPVVPKQRLLYSQRTWFFHACSYFRANLSSEWLESSFFCSDENLKKKSATVRNDSDCTLVEILYFLKCWSDVAESDCSGLSFRDHKTRAFKNRKVVSFWIGLHSDPHLWS